MKASAQTDPRDLSSPDAAGLFRAIFEQAAVGVAQIETATGRFLRVNQRYADIVGCSRPELEQLDFQTLTHPEDLPADLDNMRRLVAGEMREFTMEKRYRHRDGQFVWVNLTVSPLWADGESPGSHIAMVEDITDRKRGHAALQRSEEMFRRTFDLSPVGAVVVGLDQRFLRCNEAFCRFLGYAEAELISHSFQDVTFPEDKEIGQAELRSLVAGSLDRAEIRKRYVRKDGGVVWGELSISLVRDAQGLPLFFLPIIQDITERKRTEEALRESELRYRTLFEFSPAGILLEDDRGEILEFNEVLCGAFGYSHDELRGQNVRLLVPPQHQHLVDRHLAEIMAGKTLTHEVDNIGKDGLPRQMELRERPFPLADGRTGVLVIANDITERKRSEETLREGESRLRTIIERAPFGAHSYELQSGDRLVLTASNRSADRILGIDHASLIGQSIEEAFPGLRGTAIPETYRRLAVADGNFEDEQVVYEQGGIRGAFAIHAFHTGSNRMTVFFRDITERKRAEDALRESEARFRSLAETLPEAVFETDRNLNLTFVNRRAFELFGYSEDDLKRGLNVLEMLVPEDRNRAKASTEMRMKETEPGTSDYRALKKDGTDFPVLFHARSIFKQGQVAGFIGIVVDITKRKAIEEDLRRSQAELEEAQAVGHVGSWTSDPGHAGRLVWSKETRRIFGLSEAGFDGRVETFWSLVHPDDLAAVRAASEAERTGERPYDIDHRIVRPDGAVRWVRERGQVERDDAGKPVRMVGVVQDITERRQAEEKYQRLVETTGTGFVIVDHQGRVTDANPEYIRLTGRPRVEDVVGHSVLEWTAPHDLERNAAEVKRCLEQGFVRGLEIDYINSAGQITPIEINATVLGRGPSLQILCLSRDITERQQAEEALRNSEHLYQSLVENLHQFVFRKDRDGRFTFANQRFCDLVARPLSELIGLTDYELSLRELAEKYRRDDQQVLASGQAFEAVESLRTSAGEERFVQVVKTPLRDATGQIVGLQGIFWDITERKRAEEAQREARQLLRDVLDTVPVRVFWKDLEGRYLGCNLSNARDAGLASPDDLIGKNDYELPWREQADAYRADDRRVIETGVPKLGIEETLTNSNGHLIWLRTNKIPLKDGEGRVIGILGTYEDITDFKRAQAEREGLQTQLTQAQKMESIGRLAGGVAHDFNNMLQAILGNASLALEILPPDSRVRDNLEEIQRAGERSADLTRQLLAFARKQTIAPKVLDLNDTVAGMLKMLRRLIGEDIDLAWMPGANLWPIKVDPSQIDQILANLCVNARDAIADTGKVTIETDNVTLDAHYAATHPDCVPGDYVMLAVSDNGTGMDAATKLHLFEPFFTTKELGEGTGLGLATVFGIVKQNLGLINVYSELGQGSTFKIYLPRTAVVRAAPEPEDVRRALQGTETVLVVEDEEQILTLSRLFLQQHGYTVLTASSPEAALALVAQQQGPIHLLITDVVMPGMNGKELRARLCADHPGLKCLFMSGYTANVIAHHGVLDENVHFLEKPFTNRTLVAKVREVLDDK